MKRVPDPEIRRRQILETAMRLFYEKGYDDTSLEDIAAELGVVKGLCYRYYDSKQALFGAVLEEYTVDCCRELIGLIHDRSMPMSRRLAGVLGRLLSPDETGRYHDFFHKRGNEAMHGRLAASMCSFMMPHLTQELEYISASGAPLCSPPGVTAQLLLCGLMGVWQDGGVSPEEKLSGYAKAAGLLLGEAK